MSSMSFPNPRRTQPFIVTLFMAIMAFKRVCKMMRKRMLVLKKRTHSHQLSAFRYQLKRSSNDVTDAARGRDVIQPSFIHNQIIAEQNPHPKAVATANEVKVVRKISTQKKVRRYLDEYAVKLRLGKGAPATVDRLMKALVITDAPKGGHHRQKQSAMLNKRRSTMIMSALKAAETTKATDFSHSRDAGDKKPESGHQGTTAEAGKEEEEKAGAADEELGYEPGTHIYFGSTIALQARHGGFLSYNSSEIKASAHKILSNSRFIVKNSEDLTDVGVMRYGAALWLQAGHHDVLGAQYGTLVDQKRTIQPALVSCKRASMFKAQQYGRWIVMNRARPMQTLGQPVLHDDRIILEQEWFFLASSSPYGSHMYKTLSNSDEAMTTKTEIFNPGEECSWKMHLVAIPSEDRAGELQRQLLLQQAKESIDDSAQLRYEKAPGLLTSLNSKLRDDLTDHAVFNTQLRRKTHQVENQEYLLKRYKDLGAKNFHSHYDPTRFLSHVYGPNSNIVKYKTFVLERNESDLASPLYESAHQAVKYDASRFEHVEHQAKNPIDAAEDAYWQKAQRVLVDTKGWMELPTAMHQFYRIDRAKKIRAASVLQKWIRRFLNSSFDFERRMKQVDNTARNKLQEKLIARRKALIEHVSAIDAIDHIDKNSSNAGPKFGASFMYSGSSGATAQSHYKTRPKSGSVSGPMSQSISSIAPISRTNSAARSASLSIDNYGAASQAAATPVGLKAGQEERRRTKSLSPAARSKSLAQINDISQLVGAAGMAAIFNAAGLIPGPLALAEEGIAPLPRMGGRSQSMIFRHTAVDEGIQEEGQTFAAGADRAAVCEGEPGSLVSLHQQAHSMPNLFPRGYSVSAGRSGKSRQGSFVEQEAAARIQARNQFTEYLGFEAPRQLSPNVSSKSSNDRHSPPGTPPSPSPFKTSGLGIAYGVESSGVDAKGGKGLPYLDQVPAQRPYTANAALRPAPSLVEQLEKEAKEQEKVRHEAHKAANKEIVRAQALQEKRRLCRTASNEFGLPRDVFRQPQGDVSAVIGLKFLRAVSKNPGIYEDVRLKKRPATSGGTRGHRAAQDQRHGSGMW